MHTYELVSSKLHNRVHDMFLTFYALQIMSKISLFSLQFWINRVFSCQIERKKNKICYSYMLKRKVRIKKSPEIKSRDIERKFNIENISNELIRSDLHSWADF